MKYIFYLMIGLILIWVVGLFYFIYDLSQSEPPTDIKTDGIVVLTGGNSRLQEAVRLLESDVADKLFISGVNAKVTEEELLALLGISKKLADCCVETGAKAQNTVGNAEEISLWVQKSHMSSIRVVTSLEHMPRALTEIRHFMPEINIVAHPVGQWRPENIRLVSLIREYTKYLVSLLRTRVLDI